MARQITHGFVYPFVGCHLPQHYHRSGAGQEIGYQGILRSLHVEHGFHKGGMTYYSAIRLICEMEDRF